MFCDIHTHSINYKNKSLVDISGKTMEEIRLIPNAMLSYGIHPKFLEGNLESKLQNIRELAQEHRIQAIGECGLDKFSIWDIATQEKILMEQFIIAKQFGLPVIIHCVRLYSQITRIIKFTRFQHSVIFHCYNGNLETTKQLLNYPNIYFSYSETNTDPDCNGYKSLPIIPLERILTESDERENTDFPKIIYMLSGAKKTSYNTFINISNQNFDTALFGSKQNNP